jgi:hypothetical protein
LRRSESDGYDALDGPRAANPSKSERSMRKTVVLTVLAMIVLIIAVQFGPSLVSR